MNKYPLIEMIAFFCRHSRLAVPTWRKTFVRHLKRVRSCHTKVDGGIKKSYYSVETNEGEIINLMFNQEELIWYLDDTGKLEGYTVDRVLAHMKRHKHLPSDSHRIIPIRFEIFPKSEIDRKTPVEPSIIDRIQPYRFQRDKNSSIQVKAIETRRLENRITEVNLNFVVEDIDQRFYHVVFIVDLLDWRFMQEVDEQLLFVR